MIFQKDVSLNEHSNYKIGGKAEYFVLAKTVGDLTQALKEARELNKEVFILGGGTNILFKDGVISGVVIKTGFDSLAVSDETVRVGSGVSVEKLLDFCVENSLSGLEWAGGLPGMVGGAIFGNAGAFGGEIKDSIKEVLSVAIEDEEPKIIRRNNSECEFDYRNSVFKKSASLGRGEIIVEASFQLKRGKKGEIAKKIQEKIDFRKERHPIEFPNIGSMFKNVPWELLPEKVQKRFSENKKIDPFPILPAAVLIHEAGLKGLRVGGAEVSEKHSNFIVNVDGASSEDVAKLCDQVKAKVKEEFGVELEREVIFK